MISVFENLEKVLKSKRKDKHARYVALDIVRQALRQLQPDNLKTDSNAVWRTASEPVRRNVLELYRKLPRITEREVVTNLRNGQIIPAIRAIRQATSAGLKDSKDLIDLHPNFRNLRP